MTLQEFWDQCNRHDWFYAMSDDHRHYTSGQAYQRYLFELADTVEGGPELLAAFGRHYFSGGPFETPKAPKPERPK